MKKIYAVFLSALLFTSCLNDFLDVNPVSDIATSTFWQTDNDVRAALNSIYADFQTNYNKNSGGNYATSFSNENGSHKSSLGFYLTENTYQGRNGYSLILNGLEKGINDLAKQRAIVIHGASYSDPSVVASSGRLGRSFGCPALPVSVSKPIINTIKNGTLLFIYANDKNYLTQSSILSTQQENDIFHEKSYRKVL